MSPMKPSLLRFHRSKPVASIVMAQWREAMKSVDVERNVCHEPRSILVKLYHRSPQVCVQWEVGNCNFHNAENEHRFFLILRSLNLLLLLKMHRSRQKK